ncbi:MarR family winged helix-turn-helix transcriptional regulator [uncultured Pseudokineococcus sp.]|uniref:MarR family winged helix-turn-helix transcriptional regulator n=1 Tax=uncultured Pseudokineococcus sp. TaxID=1642928 RepID=UPI0026316E75|nr:MarR family transcriptional regulator [uncultured Pseudokineococcus sp.]
MPQRLQTRAPGEAPPAPAPSTSAPAGTAPAGAVPPSSRRPGAPGTGPSALAAELRVALMRSVRRIRAERAEDALPDSQYSVLALLERLEPTTPGALAEAEHVQPPSMTRTIAALVEAGVVDRRPHPQDGRQVLVETTQAGRDLLQATRRRRDQWLTRRLAQLSPHERAVLAEAAAILRRVVAP